MAEDAFRAFYEAKVDSYPEVDPRSTLRYQHALSLADLSAGHRVLDIACRDGTFRKLLDRMALNVDYTGLDIAERAVEANRERWPDSTWIRADVLEGTGLPDAAFDRIFALEVLEHVHSPLTMLREIVRLLGPDGHLLLSVPNPMYWLEIVGELRKTADTQGHIHSFTSANLGALFDIAGLEIDKRTGTYLELPRRMFLIRKVRPFFARSRVVRAHRAR